MGKHHNVVDTIASPWHPEERILNAKWIRTITDEDRDTSEVASAYRQMKSTGKRADGRPRMEFTGMFEWWVATPDESRYAEGTEKSLSDAMAEADRVLTLWVDHLG